MIVGEKREEPNEKKHIFFSARFGSVGNSRRCTGSSRQTENVSQAESETKETEAGENEETVERTAEVMRIRVEADGKEIIFELNDSQAAEDLYNQLPMTLENEDFSDNEK